LIPINRKAQDNKILELYEQGKTIREITHLQHVSPNRISSVLKMASTKAEEAEEAEHEALIFAIESQALKLFSIGKKPTEVAIKLRISAADTLRLHKDYWKLERYQTLVNVEAELGEYLQSFLKLFRKMKDEAMTTEDIIDISRAYRKIPYLKYYLKELKDEVQRSHDLKERYISEYISLNKRNMELERKNRELQNSNEHYLKAINEKKKELTILKSRTKDCKGLDKMDNNDHLLSEQHDLGELPYLYIDDIHCTFSRCGDSNSFVATTKNSGRDPLSEVIIRKETDNDKGSSGEKVIEKVFPCGTNEEKNVKVEPDKENSIVTEKIDPA
jgi:hypothetical protein